MINFVRFCELLVSKAANLKCINLMTGVDAKANAESFKVGDVVLWSILGGLRTLQCSVPMFIYSLTNIF